MSEAVVDNKGRVSIPKEIREELSVREGTRLRVMLEGDRILLIPPVDREEFIKEMEGVVRRRLPEDPLKVKRVWEPKLR